MTSQNNSEQDRLIDPDPHSSTGYAQELEAYKKESRFLRTRAIVWGALTVLFVLGLVSVFQFQEQLAEWSWTGTLPRNPDLAAAKILAISPVIVRFSNHFHQMDGIF
jgi:membrane dipeptidase